MENFNTLIGGEKPVVVEFYATWCGPCKMMPPILQELKSMIGDRAMILKMDIDKNPDYTNRFQVQSVPTIAIFRHGKIMWRKSGLTPAHEIYGHLINLVS